MRSDDQKCIDHIASGGKFDEGDTVSSGYRAELTRLLVTFVDSELAGAAGFADCINRAPDLPARVILAKIVSEKFSHADSVLELLRKFGVEPSLYVNSHAWAARLDRQLDLGNLRTGSDRRLNVFHYPLESWDDVVVLMMLMGEATTVQLEDQKECSYTPFAELLSGILQREARHTTEGENGIKNVTERQSGAQTVQPIIEYWYPRVAATFGRLQSERLILYEKYGLRKKTNAVLLGQWSSLVKERLDRLCLSVPAELPKSPE